MKLGALTTKSFLYVVLIISMQIFALLKEILNKRKCSVTCPVTYLPFTPRRCEVETRNFYLQHHIASGYYPMRALILTSKLCDVIIWKSSFAVWPTLALTAIQFGSTQLMMICDACIVFCSVHCTDCSVKMLIKIQKVPTKFSCAFKSNIRYFNGISFILF